MLGIEFVFPVASTLGEGGGVTRRSLSSCVYNWCFNSSHENVSFGYCGRGVAGRSVGRSRCVELCPAREENQ